MEHLASSVRVHIQHRGLQFGGDSDQLGSVTCSPTRCQCMPVAAWGEKRGRVVAIIDVPRIDDIFSRGSLHSMVSLLTFRRTARPPWAGHSSGFVADCGARASGSAIIGVEWFEIPAVGCAGFRLGLPSPDFFGRVFGSILECAQPLSWLQASSNLMTWPVLGPNCNWLARGVSHGRIYQSIVSGQAGWRRKSLTKGLGGMDCLDGTSSIAFGWGAWVSDRLDSAFMGGRICLVCVSIRRHSLGVRGFVGRH